MEKLIWKGSILFFASVAALLLSTITVSAITVTDNLDDVFDGRLNTFGSRPNIDITTVTYELSGDTVTLTITVEGNIVDSEHIKYTIWTNSTLISGYAAQYINGTGYVLKDGTIVDSEVSVSQGNTIIFTFTRLSDSTEVEEIVGYAMENSEDFSNTWADYAPNNFSPWYSGDDDDDTGDDEDDTGDDEDDTVDDDDDVIISPNGDDTGGDGNGGNGGGITGFEAIAVIAAIAVALIILRRKK